MRNDKLVLPQSNGTFIWVQGMDDAESIPYSICKECGYLNTDKNFHTWGAHKLVDIHERCQKMQDADGPRSAQCGGARQALRYGLWATYNSKTVTTPWGCCQQQQGEGQGQPVLIQLDRDGHHEGLGHWRRLQEAGSAVITVHQECDRGGQEYRGWHKATMDSARGAEF